MNLLTRCWTTALAAALLFVSAAAQEAEPEPGQKVRDRAAKDLALLLPQTGVGGSPTAVVSGEPGSPKTFKIEEEGCEKMKGLVVAPLGLDKSRKYPLVFAFNKTFWRSSDLAGDMKDISVMTDSRDPLIVCAVQTWSVTKEGNKTNVESGTLDECRKACLWALNKVMKDYPVDPERVFLVGAQMNADDATRWACHLWSEDPDAFPFRAILVDGAVSDDADSMPPVPLIITIDKGIDAQFKKDDPSAPRAIVNRMLARGVPSQFHTYEDKTIFVSDTEPVKARWQVIMRDVIQTLGGPGPREYADAKPPIGVPGKEDQIPFADSNDPIVADVIGIAKSEDWPRAFKRLKAAIDDKNVKTKDKKAVMDFKKTWDKYVQDEMKRCNESIEISIKAEAWAHSLRKARLASMVEAFKDEAWCKGKPYAANLEKLKTYPIAVREKERREKMLEAVKMELSGDREAAKKLYEAMAALKSQDGGHSEWPRAAEYRLSWWQD